MLLAQRELRKTCSTVANMSCILVMIDVIVVKLASVPTYDVSSLVAPSAVEKHCCGGVTITIFNVGRPALFH